MVLWTEAAEQGGAVPGARAKTDPQRPEPLPASADAGFLDRVLTELLPGLRGRRDRSPRRSPARF
jgi:hypothetical protein